MALCRFFGAGFGFVQQKPHLHLMVFSPDDDEAMYNDLCAKAYRNLTDVSLFWHAQLCIDSGIIIKKPTGDADVRPRAPEPVIHGVVLQ